MTARLDRRSVQDARRDGLAKEIASLTGLSLAAVRGRLSRAHGRSLLRNVFADAWPEGPRRTTTAAAEHVGLRPASQRTIHRVRQSFRTSCGVAVVAMFARVSEQDAMAVLFPNGGRVFYTHLRQLKRALDHFGVRYDPHWRRFVSWEAIPKTSLVKVRWKENGRTGLHWVIFQRRHDATWHVIDPDPPHRGTLRLSDAERKQYTGITYMPVEARPPR
jgi:hypothetical protein